MRTNLPVTTLEVALNDKFSIVSTTDLQGRITYANPYFVEISGFTVDELIGAPQNILRHPDMPQETFADLWATVKSGQPWTGLVKNRTKNGDYYWVLANITPVYDGGQAVGYMSVRTKPSPAQVAQVTPLYQAMQAGNPRKLRIKHGQVVTPGWTSWGRLSVEQQLKTGLAVTLLAFLLLGLGHLWPETVAQAGLTGWLAGLAVLGAGTALSVGMHVYRRVLKPLQQATQSARVMAGGDLTRSIEAAGQDEVGQLQNALRQMNINLRSIIGDVRSNFENITLATQEIATGNLDLSTRTETQASSLEQTAASMEELTGTVQQSASNAVQANALAMQASLVANKSGGVVNQVVTTMQEINMSSRKIADIIGLIEGIAFQTNILALNAAVEAARAGEQGRGFAVVATEVRSLAQRSAVAAKEIKQLIDRSLNKVGVGMSLTTEAGTTMQAVIASVTQVSTLINEMTEATREQSIGISEVNQAVGHLDGVTQQNAALVEEAAAAAGNLVEQTQRLTRALAVFKLPRR